MKKMDNKFKKKIKGIIFDLDGTLLDTIKDISESFNRIFNKHSLPVYSINDYKKNIGNGINNLLLNLSSDIKLSNKFIKQLTNEFINDYSMNCCVFTQLYPGIKEMLNELNIKNIKMTILSNKMDFITQKIVKTYLYNWKFEVVLGESKKFPKKPNPLSALYILKKVDLKNDEIIIIGDSDIDIQTAKNINSFSIGVTWGYRERSLLISSKADLVIDNPKFLCDIIN